MRRRQQNKPTERVLRALRELGGRATCREIAEKAGHIISGDAATILSQQARRGIVVKVGFDDSVSGRATSIWQLL